MSWQNLDKGNLLQPSSAYTRESENCWPGLWLPWIMYQNVLPAVFCDAAHYFDLEFNKKGLLQAHSVHKRHHGSLSSPYLYKPLFFLPLAHCEHYTLQFTGHSTLDCTVGRIVSVWYSVLVHFVVCTSYKLSSVCIIFWYLVGVKQFFWGERWHSP